MAKRRISVELDEQTLRCLSALGKPVEVLARMANAAAEGVLRPSHPKRERTDESLRVERDKSDTAMAQEHTATEEQADEVVRVARLRADDVVQVARDRAVDERGALPTPSTGTSVRARTILKHERSDADAVLEVEREERRSSAADVLAVERASTDRDLGGERANVDELIVNQREANEKMVRATISAQEMTEQAEAAMRRAEESERELRSVAEFREMFIGVLGHDLRNPLGSITLAASLLLRGGRLHEQDAQTTSRIIRGAQRMNRLISQVLDLTRARLGGGIPIDRKPTDLREVCRDVVDEFEADLHLEAEVEVMGTWDADRLAEVVSNLAGNAIDYAAPGTAVTVKVHTDGPKAVVEVINRGEPIPAEILPFIFEPFRRGPEQPKSGTGNLGLGLYIAKQIVLAHGGTLDATSANGTTAFVMRLPREVEQRRFTSLPDAAVMAEPRP